ncbi:MAG: hypothetical protein LW834_22825, partial [Cyanobium sp. 49614_E6]|nr:hypothetical protein [Cyanobium sp. 49614_E6]
PEGGRWQGSLPEGERHWLAALTAATPNGFLALLAVLLPLAVVLHPECGSIGRGRDRHSRLVLVVAPGFCVADSFAAHLHLGQPQPTGQRREPITPPGSGGDRPAKPGDHRI